MNQKKTPATEKIIEPTKKLAQNKQSTLAEVQGKSVSINIIDVCQETKQRKRFNVESSKHVTRTEKKPIIKNLIHEVGLNKKSQKYHDSVKLKPKNQSRRRRQRQSSTSVSKEQP